VLSSFSAELATQDPRLLPDSESRGDSLAAAGGHRRVQHCSAARGRTQLRSASSALDKRWSGRDVVFLVADRDAASNGSQWEGGACVLVGRYPAASAVPARCGEASSEYSVNRVRMPPPTA
jgi:hypothetical protein